MFDRIWKELLFGIDLSYLLHPLTPSLLPGLIPLMIAQKENQPNAPELRTNPSLLTWGYICPAVCAPYTKRITKERKKDSWLMWCIQVKPENWLPFWNGSTPSLCYGCQRFIVLDMKGILVCGRKIIGVMVSWKVVWLRAVILSSRYSVVYRSKPWMWVSNSRT